MSESVYDEVQPKPAGEGPRYYWFNLAAMEYAMDKLGLVPDADGHFSGDKYELLKALLEWSDRHHAQ